MNVDGEYDADEFDGGDDADVPDEGEWVLA